MDTIILGNYVQVRLTFSGRGWNFHLPPPYSIVIQVITLNCSKVVECQECMNYTEWPEERGLMQESEDGSWHVPTTNGDDIEKPRQWICATRKISGKSSQAIARAVG